MIRRFEPIDQKSSEIINFMMQSTDIPDDVELQMKVRLCIEEAVVNITQYAYKDPAHGWLEAYIGRESDMLVIRFTDAGVRFNPLEKEDPDITLSAEEREIGGLGIFLCKSMMDEIDYFYKDGCNVLVMKTRLN